MKRIAKDRLTVVMITRSLFPSRGGVENHLRFLVDELQRRGYATTVVALSVRQRSGIRRRETPYGTLITLPLRVSKLGRILGAFRLRRFVADHNVVHFHDYGSVLALGVPMVVARTLTRRPWYITFHGWEGTLPPKTVVVFIRRLLARFASGNISVGQFIEEWYGTMADHLIYGATGLPVSNPVPPAQCESIVFVGRLAEDQGVIQVFNAWNRCVRNDGFGYRLDVCGDGPLRRELERQVDDIDVVFHGVVEDVTEFISQARFVITSGYLAILEALAHERWVVSYGNHRLKRDYLGMFPRAESVMSIANTEGELKEFFTLFADKAPANTEGRTLAGQTSWAAVADTYEALWAGGARR